LVNDVISRRRQELNDLYDAQASQHARESAMARRPKAT
jgi:hypothetical protein